MDENKVKDMIIFLSNSSDDINEQIDTEEMEKTMDQLYYTLYYLRKEINEIIAKLPIDWLTKLVKTLQALSDCQTTLSVDVQEELEMYFYYENIAEKIEEQRGISWDDLLIS